MRSYDEELWTVLVDELFRSDKKYSNAKQKRAALEAVLTMWSAREMRIGKRIYSREMIRTLILDELFRDDIDSALTYCREELHTLNADKLAQMILEFTVDRDKQFRYLEMHHARKKARWGA